MKLIVGLGNPGKDYIDSRHNIGFMVIKAISQLYKIPLKKDARASALTGKGKIKGENIVLAMPLTFMNLSGSAVSVLLREYKIRGRFFWTGARRLENLLVVCDDLDLELGRLKVRGSGSSGGHQGLASIISVVRSQEFSRLRIGIGRPPAGMDAADYVLSSFNKKDREVLTDCLQTAQECCQVWVNDGINKSMNIFNRRKPG